MKLPHVTLSYGRRLNPARDWLILLAAAALLILASLAWNLWLFNRVASGEVLGAAPTSTSPAFSEKAIEALTKALSERETLQSRFESGTIRFVDPSE